MVPSLCGRFLLARSELVVPLPVPGELVFAGCRSAVVAVPEHSGFARPVPGRKQLVDPAITIEIDRLVVGDHGIEGAIGKCEHLVAVDGIDSRGGLGAEVGVVDDLADHGGGAGDLATGAMGPSDRSRSSVKGVHVPVV